MQRTTRLLLPVNNPLLRNARLVARPVYIQRYRTMSTQSVKLEKTDPASVPNPLGEGRFIQYVELLPLMGCDSVMRVNIAVADAYRTAGCLIIGSVSSLAQTGRTLESECWKDNCWLDLRVLMSQRRGFERQDQGHKQQVRI
jgi:hypothetical protein